MKQYIQIEQIIKGFIEVNTRLEDGTKDKILININSIFSVIPYNNLDSEIHAIITFRDSEYYDLRVDETYDEIKEKIREAMM